MLLIFTSKAPISTPYTDVSNRYLESQVKRSMIKTFNNVNIVSCTMYNITIRDHIQAYTIQIHVCLEFGLTMTYSWSNTNTMLYNNTNMKCGLVSSNKK